MLLPPRVCGRVRRQYALGELSCGARRSGPHVQSAAEITADLDADLARLNTMADRIYTRWIAGLAR